MHCGRSEHSLLMLFAVEDNAKVVWLLSAVLFQLSVFSHFGCGITLPISWGRCARSGERGHVLPGAVEESDVARVNIGRTRP